MKHIYLLVFFCSVFALSAFSQMTWTGASNTAWNGPTNWSNMAIPTATDDAIVRHSAKQPVNKASTADVARSIVVREAALLTSSGAKKSLP